jgi:hypothetical protein
MEGFDEASFVLYGCLAVSSAPSMVRAQASLLATTDLDCNWKLDGKPQGVLKADDSTVVQVSSDKHCGRVEFRMRCDFCSIGAGTAIFVEPLDSRDEAMGAPPLTPRSSTL